MSRRAALLSFIVALAAPLPAGAGEPVFGPGVVATVGGYHEFHGAYLSPPAFSDPASRSYCIDHQLPRPDAARRYRQVSGPLSNQFGQALRDADVRAVAYVLGRYGSTPDPIEAAAISLVVRAAGRDGWPQASPSGPYLDPHDLGPIEDLAPADEARLRDLTARWWDEGHRLAGPYHLDVRLDEPGPYRAGHSYRGRVILTAFSGTGVAGVRVDLSATGARVTTPGLPLTGDDGSMAIHVSPVAAGSFTVVATAVGLPATYPDVWAPDEGPAQRTAVAGQPQAARGRLAAEAGPAEKRLRIWKTGDAAPQVPVTGAVFEVRLPDGTVVERATVGPRDRTPEITVDAGGSYVVVEVEPPAGYQPAGEVLVAVPMDGPDLVEIEVANQVLPATVVVHKVDAATGGPLQGAVFEAAGTTVVTDGDGRAEVTGLMPGAHRVAEVTAPAGYAMADPVTVTVGPGEEATAVISDTPLVTVTFAKEPVGRFDPDAFSLEGAVFVVTDTAGSEAGRCTTDAAGRCELPEWSLLWGDAYCWSELTPPIGFAPAAGGCFNAGAVAVVTVEEEGRYGQVGAVKVDADGAGPLAGARAVLYHTDADGPVVAEATSTAEGRLDFGWHLPGRYCAVEIDAPVNYALNSEPVCGTLAEGGPDLTLRLINRRADVEASHEPSAPVTAPAPPTTPPPAPATITPSPPTGPMLPATGAPLAVQGVAGLLLVTTGAGLLRLGRARRTPASEQSGPVLRARVPDLLPPGPLTRRALGLVPASPAEVRAGTDR